MMIYYSMVGRGEPSWFFMAVLVARTRNSCPSCCPWLCTTSSFLSMSEARDDRQDSRTRPAIPSTT